MIQVLQYQHYNWECFVAAWKKIMINKLRKKYTEHEN